jgi:GPH family glycoside/pentoside/hexuronide:cation symporter
MQLANEEVSERISTSELLSFGGAKFATNVYKAFSAYYLMMFCTDMALFSATVTTVLLLGHRFVSAVGDQVMGLLVNHVSFKDGKYRPYFKWCALPFAVCLAVFSFTPVISVNFRIIFFALSLFTCELCSSALYTASTSMLPYLARDDVNRTKFVSFSNSGAILAFITIGTFLLPLVVFFGGGNKNKGFVLVFTVLAIITAFLHHNAYLNLKERFYVETTRKHAIKDMFSSIIRSKRIVLFLAGYCLYSMADAFKSMTTYYYVTYNMERQDLLPVIILTGLVSPLIMQPIIPKLLTYAKKESLIIGGLFATCCTSLLMLQAGNRPFMLIPCVALYGLFTAVVANLVFTVIASFSDEMRLEQNMNMSEIFAACLSLSSNTGIAVSSGISPMIMGAFGYSAQAAIQTTEALFGIKMLYIHCTATGMALSGVFMLAFLKNCKRLSN